MTEEYLDIIIPSKTNWTKSKIVKKIGDNMSNKVTLEVINSKLDYMNEKIEKIESHAERTNGKIGDAMIKIKEIEVAQLNCPARQNYKSDKENNVKWIMWIPTVITTILAIIIFFIKP